MYVDGALRNIPRREGGPPGQHPGPLLTFTKHSNKDKQAAVPCRYLMTLFFLVTLNGLQDLSSSTRDGTHAPCSRCVESQPLDRQGTPVTTLSRSALIYFYKDPPFGARSIGFSFSVAILFLVQNKST